MNEEQVFYHQRIAHTTEQLNTIIPKKDEVLIDTDKGVIVIGDGVTIGGIPLKLRVFIDVENRTATFAGQTLQWNDESGMFCLSPPPWSGEFVIVGGGQPETVTVVNGLIISKE